MLSLSHDSNINRLSALHMIKRLCPGIVDPLSKAAICTNPGSLHDSHLALNLDEFHPGCLRPKSPILLCQHLRGVVEDAFFEYSNACCTSQDSYGANGMDRV